MKKINQKIEVPIRSYSHQLNEEAFTLLKSEESDIQVSDIQDTTFILSIINRNNFDNKKFPSFAHHSISVFITAINIASLGHFSWDWKLNTPQYKFLDYNENFFAVKTISVIKCEEDKSEKANHDLLMLQKL